MDRHDQSDELIWTELMMPHIAADDARDLREIDPGRRGFGHCALPLLTSAFCIIGLRVSNHPRVYVLNQVDVQNSPFVIIWNDKPTRNFAEFPLSESDQWVMVCVRYDRKSRAKSPPRLRDRCNRHQV